jgi:hypothetical protein
VQNQCLTAASLGSIVETIECTSDALWLEIIIVKPGGKVITIEPHADALNVNVEEAVKLLGTVFKHVRR